MPERRTVRQWESLSAGSRRRWNAHGGRDAYLAGAHLTKAQRGHSQTPNSIYEAADNPTRYPRYVARHQDRLNEIARARGQEAHGEGEQGRHWEDWKRDDPGEFVQVVPEGTLDLSEWRFHHVYMDEVSAQRAARHSNAPAGIMAIEDRGPGYLYRYELWFFVNSQPFVGTGKKRRRRNPPAELRRENIEKLRGTRDMRVPGEDDDR